VQTITSVNAGNGGFFFTTGPTGMITLWLVEIDAPTRDDEPFPGITTSNAGVFGAEDVAYTSIHGNLYTGQTDTPEAWATAPAPDVGSSLALLSLSLTALGVAARQFKRATTRSRFENGSNS
jgi:hypothetical protein